MRVWGNTGWCKCRPRRGGPRRHIPQTTVGLTPVVKENYMRIILAFVVWCGRLGVEPEEEYEYDDLICEMAVGTEGTRPLTKSQLQTLIAAVEKVLPNMKGHLCCSRAMLSSWSVSYRPKHAVPLTFIYAFLLAWTLIDMGMPKVACILIMQAGCGMRPSEVLGMGPFDILLPWELIYTKGAGLLLLGRKRGTKSGHPQAIRVTNKVVLAVMWVVREASVDMARLTGIKVLGGYNWCLKASMAKRGLSSTQWSAHGPRAGYVTDMWLLGKKPADIAVVTRHESLKSLRSYLDVTSVANGVLQQTVRPFQAEALWCERHIAGRLRDILAPQIPLLYPEVNSS